MTTTWTSKLPDIINRQLPFAISETLNALALGAVEDARIAAGLDMNIKSKTLLKYFIRAPAEFKAKKGRYRARVVVAAPRSAPSDRGNILTQHEEAGVKKPYRGRSVAMPSRDIRKPGAKRTLIRGTDLRNFTPLVTNPKSGQVGGKRGSFVVTLKKGKMAGRKMLLQRYGRGKKSVRGLWLFVGETRLTPKLRFNSTVKRQVKLNLTKAFRASMRKAIATARPLKGTTQSTRL